MSTQITTAFSQQYSANVKLVVQQLESMMRDKVTVEALVGEAGYFDYIGKTEPTQRTTRHGDTTYTDTPHSRRKIWGATYDLADLIDKPDKVRTLIDPTNAYLQAFKGGFARVMDRVVLAAARGTAYTGKTGSTSTTLPAGQKVAVGTTGLTTDKLKSALKLFLTNDVPEDWTKHLAVAPQQVMDLLSEYDVTSADYNILRPLVEGSVAKWMGFTIHPTNQLAAVSGSVRYCVAWVQPAVTLAVNSEAESRITEMPNKNYSVQVWMSMDFGASRMDELGVVEIACSET
jgi:hypothetical protein